MRFWPSKQSLAGPVCMSAILAYESNQRIPRPPPPVRSRPLELFSRTGEFSAEWLKLYCVSGGSYGSVGANLHVLLASFRRKLCTMVAYTSARPGLGKNGRGAHWLRYNLGQSKGTEPNGRMGRDDRIHIHHRHHHQRRGRRRGTREQQSLVLARARTCTLGAKFKFPRTNRPGR